jgi:hypothetical protein
MRVLAHFLSLALLLSFTVSDLDAKKRSSWGGSKKSSKSFISKKRKVSKNSIASSSFDRARDKKAKQSRSNSSYKEYQAQKSAPSQQYSGTSTYSRRDGAIAGGVAGGVIGATTAAASQQPKIDIDLEFPSDNYFRDETQYRSHSSQSIESGFDSLIVIVIFIIAIAILFSFFRQKKRKPVQKELPLDIRIGGIVDIEAIENRLIVNRNNFKMKIPKSLKGYITGVGEIRLDDSMEIYNVYVSENIDDPDPLFILKIEMLSGSISVAKIFTSYETIYPSTVEEWEEWLDGDEENYPYIGGLEFTSPDGVEYQRVWEQGVEETVRSKFIEKVTKESGTSETLNIVSLYGRELENGEIEYLYLSNREDAELNNFIQIELGIAIKENELIIV